MEGLSTKAFSVTAAARRSPLWELGETLQPFDSAITVIERLKG